MALRLFRLQAYQTRYTCSTCCALPLWLCLPMHIVTRGGILVQALLVFAFYPLGLGVCCMCLQASPQVSLLRTYPIGIAWHFGESDNARFIWGRGPSRSNQTNWQGDTQTNLGYNHTVCCLWPFAFCLLHITYLACCLLLVAGAVGGGTMRTISLVFAVWVWRYSCTNPNW